LHRRFEVVPGAQAQVDWGEEGDLLAHVGIGAVYSFHMTLSYSRDPFTCFTTSMDLATFWDCHRRGFAHFGGVPSTIVYDRAMGLAKRDPEAPAVQFTRLDDMTPEQIVRRGDGPYGQGHRS
jgi:transposase